MKKSLYLLLTVTCVFIGFIAGIFVGRNTIGTWVTLNPSNGNSTSTTTQSENTTQLGKVNINTAKISELMLLPGIGSAKAKSIIEFRENYGKFTSINDLIYVDGFSYTTIEELRPYITVGG